MPRYFMYIPWHRKSAGDFSDDTPRANWTNDTPTLKQKKFTKIYFSSGQHSFSFDDVGIDVTIYVRGHGSAGGGYISNSNEGQIPVAGFNAVDASQVVTGMIGRGLKSNFAGKIKFYNCHSGEAGGNLSFASQCAAIFREKNFLATHFFGYVGSITGTYSELKMSEDEIIKKEMDAFYADLNGNNVAVQLINREIEDRQYAHKWVTVIGGEKQRAKYGRVQV